MYLAETAGMDRRNRLLLRLYFAESINLVNRLPKRTRERSLKLNILRFRATQIRLVEEENGVNGH